MESIEPHSVIALFLNILFLETHIQWGKTQASKDHTYYWTESSSEPMQNSLFFDYIITFFTIMLLIKQLRIGPILGPKSAV